MRQRLDRVGPGIRLRNESGEEYSLVTLAMAKKACSKVKRARVPCSLFGNVHFTGACESVASAPVSHKGSWTTRQ